MSNILNLFNFGDAINEKAAADSLEWEEEADRHADDLCTVWMLPMAEEAELSNIAGMFARLADVDGDVTEAERIAFRRCVEVTTHPMYLSAESISNFFDAALKSEMSFIEYASLVAASEDEPGARIALRYGMFEVATSDGPINEEEAATLHDASEIFQIPAEMFHRILEGFGARDNLGGP